MKFGSVCSGIEAGSVAWKDLGWEASWFAEIEPFPSALLAHHYPNVPNYGDMRGLPELIRKGEIEAPDMLCGGTPCQAFSVAGQRKSLDDERGNLSLVFCEIADAIDDVRAIQGKRPSILFWENVPGVLSVKDNAFGCFVGRLVGSHSPCTTETGRWPRSGYVTGPKRTLAWRTLDAKYFGVPQRRERVFLVASSTGWGVNPSKILFEFPCLCGDSETSEEPQKDASAFTPSSFGGYRQGVGTVRASGGDIGGGERNPNYRVIGTLTACDLMKGSTNNQSVEGGLLVVEKGL